MKLDDQAHLARQEFYARIHPHHLTPSCTWHDHGNDAEVPVVWLDGLDIPVVRFFDARFAENDAARSQQVTRPEGNSMARYGANMLPVRHAPPYGTTPPIFNYPYTKSREALATLLRDGELDPWHGVKLRYVNPATGGWTMPTIGTSMQLLPRGFVGRPYRATDRSVYSVVEGCGRVEIAGQAFLLGPRDQFVGPSWHAVTFSADEECVLFSFSDRPVHEALGIWREEYLDAGT